MASELTTEDILKLYTLAVQSAAASVGVETQGRSLTQVFSAIGEADEQLYASLDSFIASYRQYQNFHIQLDNKKILGQLTTPQDEQLLSDYMDKRDQTRQAFIEELKQRR